MNVGATHPAVDFSPLQAHEPGKVALMFSGGKDSRALIELFRPYLDGITIYHCDTGDMFPEIREYVAQFAKTIPHFRRIETNAPAWIAKSASPRISRPSTAPRC
jgi:3'-phosphoadenosine 5'-phosphosulfate sulfotransferase (PAPS reductase)/FAD synthetase